MKKLLSLILALTLVLSMSSVAFADEEKWDGNYAATEKATFNEIVKTYKSENNVVVNETLSFTSEAYDTNPDGGVAELTVENLEVKSVNPGKLTVTIPSLNKAGTYEWTIKETAGNTAGVTYSDSEIHVIVLVEYNNNNHSLQIAETTSYIYDPVDGEKEYTFENTFKSGSFTVAKNVEGNMANENDEFGITVTLTSTQPIGTIFNFAGTNVNPAEWSEVKDEDGNITGYTYSKSLQYSEISGEKTFADIPVGVVVTVTEDNVDSATKAVGDTGYAYVSTKVGEGDFTSLTVGDETDSDIVVTNTKGATVDTGIILDNMPYILLLVVVCAGLFVFINKKRAMED